MARPQNELLHGTLDVLILKALIDAPHHGYEIVRHITTSTGGAVAIEDGSLYPALHKLEQSGWIEAEWRPTENNRRAKFYALTRAGKRQLAKESESWARLAGAISSVVALPEM